MPMFEQVLEMKTDNTEQEFDDMLTGQRAKVGHMWGHWEKVGYIWRQGGGYVGMLGEAGGYRGNLPSGSVRQERIQGGGGSWGSGPPLPLLGDPPTS